jgi:hypothetical protein
MSNEMTNDISVFNTIFEKLKTIIKIKIKRIKSLL